MKTPSYGIDQNQDKKFIDRYWGRIPKFLHMIPEQNICIPNEDYLTLLQYVIDDEIPVDNISTELYKEMLDFISKMCNPCVMNDEDKALMRAYEGLEPCSTLENSVECEAMVCCNQIFTCVDEVECLPDPPAGICPTYGFIASGYYNQYVTFDRDAATPPIETNSALENGQELYYWDSGDGSTYGNGLLGVVDDINSDPGRWTDATGDFIKLLASNYDGSVVYDPVTMFYFVNDSNIGEYVDNNNKSFGILANLNSEDRVRICLEDVTTVCDAKANFYYISTGVTPEVGTKDYEGLLDSGQSITAISGSYGTGYGDISMIEINDGERYIGEPERAGIVATFTDTVTGVVSNLTMAYDEDYDDYRNTSTLGRDLFLSLADRQNLMKICIRAD